MSKISQINEGLFTDILNLKNPSNPPIINNINQRYLILSPTVAAGLEPEAKMADFVKDLKEIGKGGFGSVWKVLHKETQKIYCIKMIQKQGIVDDKLTDQMNREIEIMYLINHPHCLKLKNHFEDDENFYLIMPLAVKGQLYRILRRAKKFDERTAAQILRETISALQYLHSFKPPIIHRDLKPENLLINESGRVYLADFGWSNYKKNEGDIRKTFCGTPEYIAPEMLKKEGHDHRVDIWSVGVLMFELLSGYSPFSAKSNNDLYQNIRKLKIQWPIDMPPLAKNLITKILKLNPLERLSLEGILNHKWFTDNPEIKPLLSNDLLTHKEILKYHMINKITPEIDGMINKILHIPEQEENNNGKESSEEKVSAKRQSIMQKIKEKKSLVSNNCTSGGVSINIEKEQIEELKLEILKLSNENAGLKMKLIASENEIKNLKIDSVKLKEQASSDLQDKLMKLNADIERLQAKDKERLNILAELEEKNNIIREQNTKIKMQESQKEQIGKDMENLRSQVKELSKEIEYKELTVDYLMKKADMLSQEKEQQANEYQKKIDLLHLNVLESANGSNTESMTKVLSIINQSIQEMKSVFQSKFDKFTLNNEAFKKEFVLRNENFTTILSEKSIGILGQLSKMKKTVEADIEKTFDCANKKPSEVKDKKIEWLSKQVNEMSFYKKKGLDYEKKISILESELEIVNKKLEVSNSKIVELQKNVKLNEKKIQDVNMQLNNTEAKLSDYKTFIFSRAQEDERLLEEYNSLFNETKSSS